MRDDQWRDIADRIESTWPGEPGLGDTYRDELDGMRPEVVEAAIDALLIDHRNKAPSPSTVRRAAEGLEAETPVEEAEAPDTEWSDPPSAPAADAGADTPPPPPAPAAEDTGPVAPDVAPEDEVPLPDAADEKRAAGKATLGLILGIAGFVTIPLIVATAAILVSRWALKDIRSLGPGTPGEGRAQLGMFLGFIGLIVYIVVIVATVASQ